MTVNQENGVSLVGTLVKQLQEEMDAATAIMNLGRTRAAKLFSDPSSSATLQKWLSEVEIALKLSKERSEMLRSLERSSQPLQTSNT